MKIYGINSMVFKNNQINNKMNKQEDETKKSITPGYEFA